MHERLIIKVIGGKIKISKLLSRGGYLVGVGAIIVSVLVPLAVLRGADALSQQYDVRPLNYQFAATDGSRILLTDQRYIYRMDNDVVTKIAAPDNITGYTGVAMRGDYAVFLSNTKPMPSGQAVDHTTSLYLYNYTTDVITTITTNANDKDAPIVGDNNIVWAEAGTSLSASGRYTGAIFTYDISTGQVSQVVSVDGNNNNIIPVALMDNNVYWRLYNYVDNKVSLLRINLQTGSQAIIASEIGFYNGFSSDGGNLAWVEQPKNNLPYGSTASMPESVYVFDGTSVSSIVNNLKSASSLSLKNNTLVFTAMDNNSDSTQAMRYDFGTSQLAALTTSPSSSPVTDGSSIFFLDNPNGSGEFQRGVIIDSNTGSEIGTVNANSSALSFFNGPTYISGDKLFFSASNFSSGLGTLHEASPHSVPAKAPSITASVSNATNTALLRWGSVAPETSYKIYRDDQLVGTTDDTSFKISTGLSSIGTNFKVVTVNLYGVESEPSHAQIQTDDDAPTIGDIQWSSNPSQAGKTITLTVPISDATDVNQVGYYSNSYSGIADYAGGVATINLTDQQTGVNDITIRATDVLGNSTDSSPSEYGVYDPAGSKVAGSGAITPSIDSGDVMPGLIASGQTNQLHFGILGAYNAKNKITAKSKLGGSTDIVQGTGTLTIDGAATQVIFRLYATDASQWSGTDTLGLSLYAQGANPATSTPIYQINNTSLNTGDIIVSPQSPITPAS